MVLISLIGWDSQLVARRAGTGSAPLDPSAAVPEAQAAEYLLLWRNTVKPKAPFNLTPFALTLVSSMEHLRLFRADVFRMISPKA